jgi:hypothetical protein
MLHDWLFRRKMDGSDLYTYITVKERYFVCAVQPSELQRFYYEFKLKYKIQWTTKFLLYPKEKRYVGHLLSEKTWSSL